MFVRKLSALGFPNFALFNVNDERLVRSLVIWLEENVFFTELSPDLQAALRNEAHPNWNEAFASYLSQCLCPFDAVSARTGCVDWLLREAVRMVAEDPESGFAQINVDSLSVSSGNDKSFSNIDGSSQEFAQAAIKLAAVLNMAPHPSSQMTIHALASLLSHQFSQEFQDHKENLGGNDVVAFPLEKVTLGFQGVPDNTVNNACKIARLLHIRQLRNLQTQMDIAMVAAQQITADPKTDQLLGRIGRG